MIRFVLFRLWFVFLPLIFYVLYILWVRGKARRLGQPQPRLFDGPWIWAVGASLLLGIGGFILVGLSQSSGEHDAPVQVENGQLVPESRP